MKPVPLTTAAIATLVLTKAFEKTNEILGEDVVKEGNKLAQLLRYKFPSTALVPPKLFPFGSTFRICHVIHNKKESING